MGFPHTLSGAAIFLSLFICIREPSVCDVVSIRKREDPGNECLCVEAITRLACWRIISTCFLMAVNLQGREKSSSLLTFFTVLSELCRLLYFGDCPLSASVVLSQQYHDQVSFHFIL